MNRESVKADFLAGLTGSIIVLPQGVAFAMIAGMPPVYGLYAAIVLPIIAALFGSSRQMVTGPVTAISLLVLTSVSPFADPGSLEFINIVLLLTLFTGIIQLALGLMKLGTIVNFVSHSVVHGFTAGAAILIIISQIGGFLGLPKSSGLSFWGSLVYIWENIPSINYGAAATASITLISSIIFKKINKRLPHLLLGMLLGSFAAYYLGKTGFHINMVGELPAHLPPFSGISNVDIQWQALIPGAFAIALLGSIEAVAIARSISTKTGQIINPNQEFIGQGLSNLIGSMFSSYAGSGSFTRSSVNFDSGAKTPLAAIISAILPALILLFVGEITTFLPIPAMAGVILLAGFKLIDLRHITTVIKSSKREASVLSITFLATLIIDLEFAILLGVIFSLIFYLQKTSSPRIISLVPDPSSPKRNFQNARKYKLEQCPQLKIIRIEGSLFFGAVENIRKKLANYHNRKEKYLLIIGNGINLIDAAGDELLAREAEYWKKRGGALFISGLKKRARDGLKNGKFKEVLPPEHFFWNKAPAIEHIYKLLDKKKCENCQIKAFTECVT